MHFGVDDEYANQGIKSQGILIADYEFKENAEQKHSGIWKSHTTKKEKICNWADYRVPNANQDFDSGAGEFSPSEKYNDKGWSDYKLLEVDQWWK